jgi:hypothetical protein
MLESSASGKAEKAYLAQTREEICQVSAQFEAQVLFEQEFHAAAVSKRRGGWHSLTVVTTERP